MHNKKLLLTLAFIFTLPLYTAEQNELSLLEQKSEEIFIEEFSKETLPHAIAKRKELAQRSITLNNKMLSQKVSNYFEQQGVYGLNNMGSFEGPSGKKLLNILLTHVFFPPVISYKQHKAEVTKNAPPNFKAEIFIQQYLNDSTRKKILHSLDTIKLLRSVNNYFRSQFNNTEELATFLTDYIHKEKATDLWIDFYLHRAYSFGNLLYFRSSLENESVIKALIKQGATINLYENGTILHSAAMSGNPYMIKFLLTQGADPFTEDNFEKTPLDRAATQGNLVAVQLLEASTKALDKKPTKKGSKNTTKVFIKINPLNEACELGHLNIVQYLLLLAKKRNIIPALDRKPFTLTKNSYHRRVNLDPEKKEIFKKIEQLVDPKNPSDKHYCFIKTCNKEATTLCKECQKVYYCSQECQQKNLNTHQLVCNIIKDR